LRFQQERKGVSLAAFSPLATFLVTLESKVGVKESKESKENFVVWSLKTGKPVLSHQQPDIEAHQWCAALALLRFAFVALTFAVPRSVPGPLLSGPMAKSCLRT
jgi:uncharacterized Tic20 family protein